MRGKIWTPCSNTSKGSYRQYVGRVVLDYEPINWPMLFETLCVAAFNLADGWPDILDGVSADDLAEETLDTFLKSDDALGWDGERNLGKFLCGVLKNKFLNRLRRQRKTAGSFDDPDFNAVVSERVCVMPTAHRALEAKESMEVLKAKARGDRKLVELIDAFGSTDGEYNINQQLAEKMNTTVKVVVNLRKKLKRLVKQVKREGAGNEKR